MTGVIPVAVVSLMISGCARVPNGATFEVTHGPMPLGLLLSDQKLMLPWVPLSSSAKYEWCFANLGFSSSSAQVFLEIVNRKPFDPRNAGGAVELVLADSDGGIVYQSKGELRDSDNGNGASNHWVSEYFHYSSGPSTDLKSAYFGSPQLRTNISRFGRYCAAMNVAASGNGTEAHARLVLQSGWK